MINLFVENGMTIIILVLSGLLVVLLELYFIKRNED